MELNLIMSVGFIHGFSMATAAVIGVAMIQDFAAEYRRKAVPIID